MCKTISVISGKGGTGKSTVSSGLAISFAKTGKSVLLVDLDIGLRSLDIMVGLENKSVYDIGDIISGRCDLEKATIQHNDYPDLSLLCSPFNIDEQFSIQAMIDVITKAKVNYDYLVLDLSAGLGLSVLVSREVADNAIIVTTIDPIAMRDCSKISNILTAESSILLNLVINKVEKKSMLAHKITDLDTVIDSVGVKLIGVIPADPWIEGMFNTNKGIKQVNKKIPMIFDAISRRICDDYVNLILTTV